VTVRWKRNAATVLVTLAASCCAIAHEFWIAADPFDPAVDAQTAITLNVGQYFTGERVGVTTSHAKSVRVLSAGKDQDLQGLVPTGSMLPALVLSFPEAGSHMLVYESHPSQIELEAGLFQAYLHDEGLDAIITQRAAAGAANTPGRERFRRSAKTLLRVGDAAPDDTSMRMAGIQLEITPKTDPLAAAAGDMLRFVLTFEGKPRAGVLIKAWHKQGRQTTTIRATTDPQGAFVLTLPFAGMWMLNAVHMVPATDSAGVDWDSYWGSLTFDLARRK
jgi:hypothetical protein